MFILNPTQQEQVQQQQAPGAIVKFLITIVVAKIFALNFNILSSPIYYLILLL